jgi:hypothetical protein
MYQIVRTILVVLIASCVCGCGSNVPARPDVATDKPLLDPALLHLPGIGGERAIDRALLEGITTGGIRAEIEIYDWTAGAPGVSALVSRQRNDAQAQIVADFITRRWEEDPRREIYVTSHSGGAAIAVWALEKLPADVRITSLTMLAPALSPGYDLSAALAHVHQRAYCFYSRYDPVLGLGTRLFGTIDGVKTEAAGRVGFDVKDANDPSAYQKLEQFPYDAAWGQLGHLGDHVGAMKRDFAREVIAPLLATGKLPVIRPASTHSTTRPVTTAPATGAAL